MYASCVELALRFSKFFVSKIIRIRKSFHQSDATKDTVVNLQLIAQATISQ